MKKLPDGTYLVRDSENPQRKGNPALSIKFSGTVRHIKIEKNSENMYYMADTRFFHSLPELIEFYQRRIHYQTVFLKFRLIFYIHINLSLPNPQGKLSGCIKSIAYYSEGRSVFWLQTTCLHLYWFNPTRNFAFLNVRNKSGYLKNITGFYSSACLCLK
ncbi:uncharacterized protein LOC132745644 [Ruditapes philippinarum]|uniref:uncharacterized protein LOC132745644 n=1 Tax=Ruditapes philippinarum TaxID=129788 RepID=UPI00295BF66B|nr:uncharacterized protein LOC132745644 [Ruditapes philippinarum]